MTEKEAKQAEGRRAIFTHNPRCGIDTRIPPYVSSYYEATILEVSPSNQRVKLRYVNELERWNRIDELHLVEILR